MPFDPSGSIPLSAALWFFGIFLIIYLVYTIFNAFHLLKFGLEDSHVKGIVAFYGLVSIALIAASLLVIGQYDWSERISLGDAVKTSSDIINTDL